MYLFGASSIDALNSYWLSYMCVPWLYIASSIEEPHLQSVHWQSGHPPNEHPLSWSHRAGVCFPANPAPQPQTQDTLRSSGSLDHRFAVSCCRWAQCWNELGLFGSCRSSGTRRSCSFCIRGRIQRLGDPRGRLLGVGGLGCSRQWWWCSLRCWETWG